MNLRSAIEGEPQSDGRRTLMPEDFCMDQEHKDMLKEKGRAVLHESGAYGLLIQLAGLIAEQGVKSEIDIRGRLLDDGTVEEMVRWDPGQWDGVGNNMNMYKGVRIRSRSLMGDVFVQGRETELVSRRTWKTDEEAMVYAIAAAYRNPALINWPPVQIG